MTQPHGSKLGGFQSGFHAKKIAKSQCTWPKYLICNHDCEYVIQLVSHVSGVVEFEMCEIEAKKMAEVLLNAIDDTLCSSD